MQPMSLSSKQKQLIAHIDSKVMTIISNGGDETNVCVAMLEHMPEISTILFSASEKELEMYLDEYEGFCYYMKLLEILAYGIKGGRLKAPCRAL